MISRRTLHSFAFITLFLFPLIGVSQLGAKESDEVRAPIQIESRETSKEGNLAIAKGDVVIGVGDTTIYCDYAQCDIVTRDVLVSGDVRIYRGEKIFVGDRAVYNLDSKKITGSEFRTSAGPFLAEAHSLISTSSDSFEATHGMFTTDNTSDPGFHLRARKVRILRNDHTEYENVTVYVGRTPVFWLPYLYQPGRTDQSFSIAPGSNSIFGPFLMTKFAFPVSGTTYGGLRLDYMAKRGLGVGVDLGRRDANEGSWGRLRSYYVDDKNPGTNELRSTDNQIPASRFRVSIQDRTFLSETVYTSVNFNKLSDINFLSDFSPAELRRDPNPDSLFAITKWSENYLLNLEVRKQFNKDFQSVESLPALSLDLKRQPFLDTGIFYDGETSVAKLRRNFLEKRGEDFEYINYDTVRLDTFHQWSYPQVFGGWLSVIPRVGVRGTHYGSSVSDPNILPGNPSYRSAGALDRGVLNAGVETSFKISRVFESVESRAWGLDGLRHILQPFANLSWVSTSRDPSMILPLDSLNSSTKFRAIDFPQFNTIDSISNWDVLRLGMRNRLQTHRDQDTLNWMELETFMDLRFQQPDYGSLQSLDGGRYSNLSNRLRWNPLPWIGFTFESQLPVLDDGFTEFNSLTSVQVTRDFSFTLGNRYDRWHEDNKFFRNSNLLTGGARYRLNDNWAMSFDEHYEYQTRQLEYQRYSLERDLRSWVAAFSLVVRERSPRNDVAFLLTLLLKDVPKFRLPLHVDPEAMGDSSGSSRSPN